jgi:hypothetical protein
MGVFLGKMVCPPIRTVGVCDGQVAPQNSVSTEKVAPVSRRRHMGHPSTKRLTLGSRNEMVVARRGVPRPLQSSVASPMRSGLECEADLTPRWEPGQSTAQSPGAWHLGHGRRGGLGWDRLWPNALPLRSSNRSPEDILPTGIENPVWGLLLAPAWPEPAFGIFGV